MNSDFRMMVFPLWCCGDGAGQRQHQQPSPRWLWWHRSPGEHPVCCELHPEARGISHLCGALHGAGHGRRQEEPLWPVSGGSVINLCLSFEDVIILILISGFLQVCEMLSPPWQDKVGEEKNNSKKENFKPDLQWNPEGNRSFTHISFHLNPYFTKSFLPLSSSSSIV